MFKLIKYEFRKQLLSKVIILLVLAILEILFLFGLFTEKEDLIGTAMILFTILTFGAMFFVSFESILTFSNDLRTKHSYMLFLTPHSSYSIVGAKVISSMLQILLTTAAFVAFALINFSIVAIRYSTINEVFKMFKAGFRMLLDINLNMGDFLLVLLSGILSWIAIVIVAMLSITLSTTLLSTVKWKGVLSVVFFLVLNWGIYNFLDVITPETQALFARSSYILSCMYMMCIVTLAYAGTSWMLDKKVSV